MAFLVRSAKASTSTLFRAFSTSTRVAASNPPNEWASNPKSSSFAIPAEVRLDQVFENLGLPEPAAESSSSSSSASTSPLGVPSNDAWWKMRSNSSENQLDPGNQYSGRTLVVRGANKGFAKQFKQLGGVLARSNIKTELRIAEFYEKPSDRRRRVESERHRRRFQQLVSFI